MSCNTSTHESSALLNEANSCAKTMALGWIRSVFCQVNVQTLKRLWTVTTTNTSNTQSNLPTNDNRKQQEAVTHQLHVTHEHLKACELACLQLGRLWCQRMRDSGQNQVAEWVHQVMEEKRFWETDDSNAVIQGRDEAEAVVIDDAAETTVETRSALKDYSKQEVEPLPLPTNSNGSRPRLIQTKIRLLGQRRIGAQPPVVARVSRTLDELGRKGETAWPYDWSIIEQAAHTNVKRLYLETLKGRPRSRPLKTAAQYEVVPKSLVEREQQLQDGTVLELQGDGASASASSVAATSIVTRVNQNDNQEEMNQILACSDRLAEMVDRKRKAATAALEACQDQQHRSRRRAQQERLVASPQLAAIARLPSLFGREEHFSWKHDVVGSLSEQERDYLERNMIHHQSDADNDHDSSSRKELHSALGALKQVGAFHSYVQNQECYDYDELSEQKRRRDERKHRKQRLFPHEAQKDERETKRAVTKVVRTVDDAKRQHWMELDMGECLLEVVDAHPESNQKTLCAFSSLEVTLLDEDVAPPASGDRNEGNT